MVVQRLCGKHSSCFAPTSFRHSCLHDGAPTASFRLIHPVGAEYPSPKEVYSVGFERTKTVEGYLPAP